MGENAMVKGNAEDASNTILYVVSRIQEFKKYLHHIHMKTESIIEDHEWAE